MIKKNTIKIDWTKVVKISQTILAVFVFFVALLVVISVLPIPGNFDLYVVRSGSMSPTLKVGDLILTKKTNSYQPGDIITFTSPDGYREIDSVTHRLVEKKDVLGQEYLVTKGDANEYEDSDMITEDKILGEYQLRIPLLGYLLGYARTLPGLIVLIIAPALLIIYDESRKIIKEITRTRKKDK